jgi:arabinose-5-phosphate isomerase
MHNKSEWLIVAREALTAQAQAIEAAAARLEGSLTRAVEIILEKNGKVVVCGIGKSGQVGQKIVATLCSAGTPAVFLHPVEALHGDLGIYSPGDPTLLISKSGATAELLRLVPVLRQFDSPLIGLLGNTSSPLAREVDVVIDASVRRESDPESLVPTASSTVAMALGDALALVLMKARNFTAEDFHRFHPAGQLGRNLRLTVRDVMHDAGDFAAVQAEDSVKTVVIAMTRRPQGAACVLTAEGDLLGLITDGDLRRAFQQHDDIRKLSAADIMTRQPVTVSPDASLHEALRLMEDRPSQISVLPVVETGSDRCLGLLRIHDLYQAENR